VSGLFVGARQGEGQRGATMTGERVATACPAVPSLVARRQNGCVQQEKLFCNCCNIRESDWCMLLDPVKIKSIHQSGSRILQQLQSSFFC